MSPQYVDSVLDTNAIIVFSSGKLLNYSGDNNSGMDLWIQTFDANPLVNPLTSYKVEAGASFSIGFSPGRLFAGGVIAVAYSSTQATYTDPGNVGTLFVEYFNE